MTKSAELPPAPTCEECGSTARIAGARRVYPFHRELWHLTIWLCDCGAYVGCHPNSRRPLGTCAGKELRRARRMLHEERVDPIWKNAILLYPGDKDAKAQAIIRSTARRRTYDFLAEKLGITREECHIAMFDIEQCRRAWVAFKGVDYAQIRAWAKAKKEAA